ncbi:MAG: hypothetical protein AB7Q42_18340 [Acidimicrobiia bacterium]
MKLNLSKSCVSTSLGRRGVPR